MAALLETSEGKCCGGWQTSSAAILGDAETWSIVRVPSLWAGVARLPSTVSSNQNYFMIHDNSISEKKKKVWLIYLSSATAAFLWECPILSNGFTRFLIFYWYIYEQFVLPLYRWWIGQNPRVIQTNKQINIFLGFLNPSCRIYLTLLLSYKQYECCF